MTQFVACIFILNRIHSEFRHSNTMFVLWVSYYVILILSNLEQFWYFLTWIRVLHSHSNPHDSSKKMKAANNRVCWTDDAFYCLCFEEISIKQTMITFTWIVYFKRTLHFTNLDQSIFNNLLIQSSINQERGQSLLDITPIICQLNMQAKHFKVCWTGVRHQNILLNCCFNPISILTKWKKFKLVLLLNWNI